MVESWKSFIKRVQQEWAGGIFWTWAMEMLKETVKNKRQQELSNNNTINELWDTDEAATLQHNSATTEQLSSWWNGKDDNVKEKYGQAFVSAANKIVDTTNKIKSKVGWYVAWQVLKWVEAYAKAETNKAEKEMLLSEDVYEDTAKLEKVAGVDGEWEQLIKSQARKEYDALQSLWKYDWGVKKIKEAFPQYREALNWREYRSDWEYIIDRPVWYTADLLGTMQDAYNSVTYAYANDGVVLTPDDLKEAYPEYKNVSDWTLANFISWCLYDVQRWEKSDVQTIADYLWEMSMTEGYTSRMDWFIDLLSDESFMKWSMDREMSKNKEGEIDMWNAGSILKELANQIREVWAFTEGQSDWSILSTYRHMDNEYWQLIDKYMTLLEDQEKHDWITAFVANLYNNYKGNVAWARIDLKDKDFVLWDTQREAVQKEMARYRDWFAKIAEEIRQQSESEARYPMKNFFEYTVLWKYIRDNNWNYYLTWPLRKQKLAYSRLEDWTYMDSDWNIYSEDQVRAMTAGWMANWMLSAFTSIADKGVEAFVDASRIWTAYEEGWLKATTQYDFALAWDVISASLWVLMTNPMVQLEFNAPLVWPVVSWGYDLIMENLWAFWIALLEEIWVADWWTTESKEKTEEMISVLWLMLAHKTLKVGKEELKRNPKMRATKKAIDSFVRKIFKNLNIRDAKKLEKMIEDMNLELERQKEERQKNRLEQQQKSDTTLAQDVRAWEKSDRIIEKETEQKKEEVKKKWEEAKKEAELPLFTFLRSEIEKAKSEFFDEFYEEYKKEVGWEENMDQNIVLQKDLNDMDDPEKRQKLIEKYNELFLEEEINKNLEEWANFWEEITNLRKQVLDSIIAEQEKQAPKTTKEVQEEQAKWKKPTKRYEKIERKSLNLPINTKTEVRQNPFRYILREILEDFVKPIKKRWKIIWFERKVKEISRVMVQERIMEKWKEMAQQYMNRLQENRKKIFDFKKEFFDTTIDYDIKDFFTRFLKETWIDNILSKLFKEWKLSIEEVFDENWESRFEIVYSWEQRIPEEYVREAIDMFNDMFKEIQKYWKDWKLLLDEASLYELRNMMKRWWFTTSGKEKSGKFADVAQDLYTIFNDYLDTYREKTGIWKDIRPYDAAFWDFFELMDLLDWFFNWDWEIKKESRNRLINIAEKAWNKIDLLDKLIPWTKDVLRLMESWHAFITDMVTFMEKTDYKTWFGKRVLKYWPMMLTAIALKSFLPFWLSAILAIPVWETIWEKIRNLLGRKRPALKDIQEVLNQLDLTEEEKRKIFEQRPEEFRKTLEDLDANFDEKLREILWDYERWRQTEEWPRAYDRKWNEVVWTDEEWNSPDQWSWWPEWPTSWWPKSGWEKIETRLEEKSEETIIDEKAIEREENEALAESFQDEFDVLDNTSKKLQQLVVDFVAWAEDKKEAKLRVAAAWFKITNTIVSLLDSPEVRKAKKDADSAVKAQDWKYLQKKIGETTWDERRVYTNALYKLILAQKAPMTLISIDSSELRYLSDADLWWLAGRDIGRQKANPKYQQATARISWEDIGKEVANRDTVKNDDSDYDQIVKEWAKKSESKINKNKGDRITEWDVKWVDEQMQKKNSETAKWVDENDEQYQEDVEKERTSNKYNESSTERDLKKRLRITAKEWEITIDEVWQLSPEKMTSRDNIWFSFDKFWNNKTKTKDRMRYNDKNQRIINHNGKDYIDWWALYWTAEIDWWGNSVDTKWNPIDSPTKVYVNSLEVFDNFPSLEKLPEDTLVVDMWTKNVYTMEEIRRMDIHWETNRANVEKYYEELYNSYPKEVQEWFSEWENTEKTQVEPSTEWKSEPQETQAEQSSTKEEKTSNPEDIEEYFKSEKSDFDINELTEEELHNNISGGMSKEYNAKIWEEILKRFEARYDKLTLNEIRNEIEMADMWYWKEVKKKFKDLLKRKEKDEIDHLFWEDKKTAEETNADSLVEAIKKYNWVDVAEFISHKWDKKGKTHIHLKDMTASDSRSFQEFVMNHKDLIEIYDDWWMGYVIKFKPWFKDNIKKYLK